MDNSAHQDGAYQILKGKVKDEKQKSKVSKEGVRAYALRHGWSTEKDKEITESIIKEENIHSDAKNFVAREKKNENWHRYVTSLADQGIAEGQAELKREKGIVEKPTDIAKQKEWQKQAAIRKQQSDKDQSERRKKSYDYILKEKRQGTGKASFFFEGVPWAK